MIPSSQNCSYTQNIFTMSYTMNEQLTAVQKTSCLSKQFCESKNVCVLNTATKTHEWKPSKASQQTKTLANNNPLHHLHFCDICVILLIECRWLTCGNQWQKKYVTGRHLIIQYTQNTEFLISIFINKFYSKEIMQ